MGLEILPWDYTGVQEDPFLGLLSVQRADWILEQLTE